ncbi:hypothetical protein [Nitrosomonas sp.]|uniref:hypothetical protein n=1 Tax=Nitrosomonas sp. TaxID=42353 RepID=UPI0025D8F956|nr:hypothetical protein [Nitrosomonas sp.]
MRQTYPATFMCRVFDASESGFHTWNIRPQCEREREKGRLKIEMLAAHQCVRQIYSVKRPHSDLTKRG